MLGRELALVFRSRVTWVAAALGALLVGHGFILAVDIFSSASRSALAGTLMRREMDPLAGIVRPTVGGAELALALLAPLVASRVLAIEKERRSFRPLALAEGSIPRVLMTKLVAAAAGCLLFTLPVLVSLTSFVALGGQLDLVEILPVLLGHVLYLVLVVAVSMAAAAWTETAALAATVVILFSVASWALDAAEGFAALAWLGPIARWSLASRLVPFDRGLVSVEALLALVTTAAGAIAAALVGVRFDWSAQRRLFGAALVIGLTALVLAGATQARRTYDVTEERRASLPPDTVTALRALDEPLAIEVWLDAEDSRRRQVDSDVLSKLRLARGDIQITFPLDARGQVASGDHDDRYGVLVLHAGRGSRETRSTSRREIVILLFEAAGRGLPPWTQPEYPGHPAVIEGTRRTLAGVFAYGVVPGLLLLAGAVLTRSHRRKPS